jgi:hypothetical protein
VIFSIPMPSTGVHSVDPHFRTGAVPADPSGEPAASVVSLEHPNGTATEPSTQSAQTLERSFTLTSTHHPGEWSFRIAASTK